MTAIEVRSLIPQTSPKGWINATWEEFVAIADAPESAKVKCYYFEQKMWVGVETMGVGPAHAIENTLMTLAIGLFCMVNGIKARGLTNASYRKTHFQEAQPDLSYYFGNQVMLIPEGNTVVDLDSCAAPDLVIEVAATSLTDDIGLKRMLYEALGVKEYWVIDVENSRILAFEMIGRGSQSITTSTVLPGLAMGVLAAALRDRKTQDDSQIMAGLMAQFQT
jgi:Uma2 family endonuclease